MGDGSPGCCGRLIQLRLSIRALGLGLGSVFDGGSCLVEENKL